MPKTNKKPLKKAELKSLSEKNIQDRLAACGRGELKDIVYIGDVVEKILLGEFGAILRALLKGRSSMELNESRMLSKMPAERYLGRLDAYERILDDLEQYVLDKDSAFEKVKKESAQKGETEMQHAPEIGEGLE